MMSALWVSKTGLGAQDTALRVISNNLANVSTIGFKRDRAMFQDLLYQIQEQPGGLSSQETTLPSGLQLGTGVQVGATQKIFTPGNLQITDQPLDLAIDGRGFFQITMPDGTPAYTRDGQFQLDEDGQIVTSEGRPLEPAINIPTGADTITIGIDGTVTVMIRGDIALTQVGNLQLADFINPSGLQAMGGNLFRETPASGAPQVGTPSETGLGALLQGNLETSNVSVVEELVNMVSTQRAYEMNSRFVSTADQMLQFVTQNM
ncbi:MAG: flagellar basal-body rod protein FlgG [Gammaproteobacteria bacterium]|nr:flagellar basal-body rod protein FlgG [Gammaproteobacteria bacterium]